MFRFATWTPPDALTPTFDPGAQRGCPMRRDTAPAVALLKNRYYPIPYPGTLPASKGLRRVKISFPLGRRGSPMTG